MPYKISRTRPYARLFLVVFFIMFGGVASAQEARQYHYDKIEVDIEAKRDSMLEVTETQTFNFTGEYHEAWRTIPHEKISGISDIQVFDGETGKPLTYVGGKRDKLNPANWGKFTHEESDGSTNIIWYYSQADTSHSWILKYKILGAISFGELEDRLYWNIFTDKYAVPIDEVMVRVSLPTGQDAGKERLFAYRGGAGKNIEISKGLNFWTAQFIAKDFAPKEAFTIDIGFPTSHISKLSFWLGWLGINYGYVGGLLIIFASLIIGLVYWYITEASKKGRGTVIPQYAPPENLRPAMAEVIVKEQVTDKGLTATIIDLAVRGYVKIEEEPSRIWWLKKAAAKAPVKTAVPLTFLLLVAAAVVSVQFDQAWFLLLMPACFIFLLILVLIGSTDYTVSAIKDYKHAEELEKYEKKYLDLLLIFDGKFSTKKLRNSSNQTKKDFKELLDGFKQSLYRETELDTGAYERGVSLQKKGQYVFKAVLIAFVVAIYLIDKTGVNFFASQIFDLIGALAISAACLFAFVSYEARLNEKGRILREDWLGFKMYLEVAERYRLQNLTPDLFEKFLPYAIIFKVEKQWAKAFEGIAIAAPIWYAGNSYHGGSADPNFSPTSFSSSFSSSFTSAFASSGASGGAGGGGAGGGGGGGGGGAS